MFHPNRFRLEGSTGCKHLGLLDTLQPATEWSSQPGQRSLAMQQTTAPRDYGLLKSHHFEVKLNHAAIVQPVTLVVFYLNLANVCVLLCRSSSIR